MLTCSQQIKNVTFPAICLYSGPFMLILWHELTRTSNLFGEIETKILLCGICKLDKIVSKSSEFCATD